MKTRLPTDRLVVVVLDVFDSPWPKVVIQTTVCSWPNEGRHLEFQGFLKFAKIRKRNEHNKYNSKDIWASKHFRVKFVTKSTQWRLFELGDKKQCSERNMNEEWWCVMIVCVYTEQDFTLKCINVYLKKQYMYVHSYNLFECLLICILIIATSDTLCYGDCGILNTLRKD